MERIRRAFLIGIAIALGLSPAAALSATQGTGRNSGLAARPAFREPATLSSQGGVLEVRLTAHQGHANLDTTVGPAHNALVFAYELLHGIASDGKRAGDNSYPAPTLQVFPGETLIVHLENGLSGLTIRDYFDPQYAKRGEAAPIYPPQMTSSPINLHLHGVHVSPKGNADNVLLHIAPGMSNTYTYHIPKNMPQGAYWYHSHLHTLTAAQTYFGLAGLLAIGRTDGNLPVVTSKRIPIRNMVLQYNYVFDRAGGLAQMNNPNWPQYVSTITPPAGEELANGKYRPLLTPVNFAQSAPGKRYVTVWHGGPLSLYNKRGQFQFIPDNLQHFTPLLSDEGSDAPADPSLPDHRRDVQFTVNGQFQPVIKTEPGQTEIWVLANLSDFAYINVTLTETETGRHPPIAIVGQDGNPLPKVQYPITDDGARLLIPPATRYAIAVTMPASGGLMLEMPPQGGGTKTMSAPGILYTNKGDDNPPGVLGAVSVTPSAISYFDGFFVFPTQVLVRAVAAKGRGVSTMFRQGQPLGAYTSFVDVSRGLPDVKRELVISGGFLNDKASTSDPKAFVYAFDGAAFPNTPLIQPRLGSVEEWNFTNKNNDEHPIHVHVNDFQVTHYLDPTTGVETGPAMQGIDNANVPAPTMGPEEKLIEPGLLSLRTKFEDYTGLFVQHCHRLNHEDNGLMTLINVIPAVSTYAVAVAGAPGRPAKIDVYDSSGDRRVATVTPFPAFEGSVNVAMGDVDGDNVLDLVVGAGNGHAPQVVAYSGAAVGGKSPFSTELTRFAAFSAEQDGGISVATAQIDGSSADNIIVGSPSGIADEVRVYGPPPVSPTAGDVKPALFSSFNPYPGDRSGVTVAAGFVDFLSGRNSIVTAPGPGSPTQVKVFYFSLMTPIGATVDVSQPTQSASFLPFGDAYRGGVSLATGWLAASLGGAARIVVGQMTRPGAVKVFSSGSALQGGPEMYLQSAMEHSPGSDFVEMARFSPFVEGLGTSVATTSTIAGADLLVSGMSPQNHTVEVAKYRLVGPTGGGAALQAALVGKITSTAGSAPNMLGGK